MARNTLLAYSNRQTQFEIYTDVKAISNSRNGCQIAFYSKKLAKTYKVYGNNKGKYKYFLNFKRGLKLYEFLTKMYINLYQPYKSDLIKTDIRII